MNRRITNEKKGMKKEKHRKIKRITNTQSISSLRNTTKSYQERRSANGRDRGRSGNGRGRGAVEMVCRTRHHNGA